MSDPIRVLIADDHTIFREGVTALLEAAPGIDVVGEAGTGEEAIAKAGEATPDVILMDIMMPDLNGVAATKRILRRNPAIGVIMLTMLEDDETVFAAMCAGARGYILKGSGKAEVLHTIEVVAGGSAVFGPAIAGRLVDFFSRRSAGGKAPLPGTHAARARSPGAYCQRCRQPGYRRPVTHQPQDGGQSYLKHLQQTACVGPRPGHRQGPSGGVWGMRPKAVRPVLDWQLPRQYLRRSWWEHSEAHSFI